MLQERDGQDERNGAMYPDDIMFDYQDSDTLELTLRHQHGCVVLQLTREDLEDMLAGLDQKGSK
jgi:hypothetical protein